MTTKHDNTAVQHLADALLIRPRAETDLGRWRWMVRQRMVDVREVLATETADPLDGVLAHRHGATQRERTVLLTRLSQLGPQVLAEPDVEPVATEIGRLVGDIRHHLQRRSDLAWDDVQQEFGGSE